MSKLNFAEAFENLPKLAFIDTNILDALPEDLTSGEFSRFLAYVKALRIQVAVPSVVSLEWLKHRKERAEKNISRIRTRANYINKYQSDAVKISINDREFVTSVGKEGITLLKSLGINIAPPPSIDINEITYNAVEEIPPFEPENKGFKDELIVLSLVEYTHKLKSRAAILISNDRIFGTSDLKKRLEDEGIELILLKSIKEADEWFNQEYEKLGQVLIAEKNQRAKEFVEQYWSQIKNSIKDHVMQRGYIYEGELFGLLSRDKLPVGTSLSKIIEVSPLKINEAVIGDTPTGTKTPLTIYVTTKFDIQATEWPHLSMTKVLLGEKLRFDGVREEKTLPKQILTTLTREKDIPVEATVVLDKDDNFSDFQISEVRLA